MRSWVFWGQRQDHGQPSPRHVARRNGDTPAATVRPSAVQTKSEFSPIRYIDFAPDVTSIVGCRKRHRTTALPLPGT